MSNCDHRPPTIGIVGAGASGTLAALHLLRWARQPLEIALFDRRSQPGRGIAFGTEFEAHLLNVRAGNMSAFPDQPLHFVDWLRHADVGDECRAASPTDFVPRRVYGQYLDATLRSAHASVSRGVLLDVRSDEIIALGTDGRTLELRGGTTTSADRIVLALGNFPPQPVLTRISRMPARDPRLREDPWGARALDSLGHTDAVLLVGTGLTMVDVVVSLVLERGHQGPIYAVSRRGQLPQVHTDSDGYVRTWADSELPQDVLGLVRRVRHEVGLADRQGYDWRGVVDSLRPVTQSVWQRASGLERERFLRHLQPFWDTHRHRVAPRIGSVLADTRAKGQLTVWAGRLVRLTPLGAGVRAEVAGRRGSYWTADIARAINCTGPALDVKRVDEPLVASLLAGGLARPDSLHLGLATTTDGRLVDANGSPSQHLFTLGPMRRGELWETTSVPDIRVQAASMAEILLGELGAN